MRRLDWSLTEIAPTEAGRRSRYAWNVPLTTTLRGGAEEERLRMMAVLEGVAPGWISQGPPAPRWSFSTSGRFTVSMSSKKGLARNSPSSSAHYSGSSPLEPRVSHLE
ncbi:hypothetical protein LINPERHAP1_LOCUS508, partial [Linum perenne]